LLTYRKVAVILLDVRYSRTPWSKSFMDRSFFGGKELKGDMLGTEQWLWLEGVMSESSANVHLIVSGLQILPEYRYIGESWSRFPQSKERILQMILKYRLAAPVLLSGDVHMAEMNVARCQNGGNIGSEALLVEVTSSGMTHSWKTGPPSSNNFIVTGLMRNAMQGSQFSMPFTYLIQPAYLGMNFGEIEIDWDSKRLDLKVHGPLEGPQSNLIPIHQSWAFDELGLASNMPEGGNENWVCDPIGGTPSYLRVAFGVFGAGIIGVVLPLTILVSILFVLFRLIKLVCHYPGRQSKMD